MNNTITYRPYELHKWFLYFTVPIGVLAFTISGYCLLFSHIGSFVLCGMGIMSLWLTKELYDSSNISVHLEQEGLRITGGSFNEYRYMTWEKLQYEYYDRNFKGHLFIVLTPNVLNPKEIKAFINRGANLSRICIDDVVVIPIDALQDTSQFREFIDKRKTV